MVCMSSKEVSRATRVQLFMDEKEWLLSWTPPYIPSFQRIELFWAYGKGYVTLELKKDRKLNEVYDHIRQSWCWNKDWPVQKGECKEANCEGSVVHAIQGMNAWIEKDDVLNGTIRSFVIPHTY